MKNSAASSIPTIIVLLQDIYVHTQRLHSKWDMEWGGEEDISVTVKQSTNGGRFLPLTPYHWGQFPGPFILFCTLNLLLSNYLSPFPVTLKTATETLHSSFFPCKLTSTDIWDQFIESLCKAKRPSR